MSPTLPNGGDTSPVPFPAVVIRGETFVLKNSMSAAMQLAKSGADLGNIWRYNQDILAASTDAMKVLTDQGATEEAKRGVMAQAHSALPKLQALQMEMLSAFTAHKFIAEGKPVPTAMDWAVALDGDPNLPVITAAIWKAFSWAPQSEIQTKIETPAPVIPPPAIQ